MKLAPWLLLCLCLTGCFRSKVLLEDPEKAVLDKNLVGFWSQVEGKSKFIYAVGSSKVKGNPAGLVCFQRIGISEEGQLNDPGQSDSKYAFTVTVGNYGYLCLIGKDFAKQGEYAKWMAAKDQNCYICRYRIDKNQLTVWEGDPRKLTEQGLESEMLPGVQADKSFAGTRAELVEFLKTKSDKLFPDEKKLVYTRVAL